MRIIVYVAEFFGEPLVHYVKGIRSQAAQIEKEMNKGLCYDLLNGDLIISVNWKDIDLPQELKKKISIRQYVDEA